MTQTLTEELWTAIEPVYAKILDHPFLAGLTDGTLPRTAFRHFVVQDSHYLRDYARALALCAAKAPGEREVRAFADDAIGALAAEQGMHAEFLNAFGDTAEQAAAEPVLPTTRAYTSYLLATVYGGSFAEAVAAVLPCYWIYARVGEQLLAKSSPTRSTRSGSRSTATRRSSPWFAASWSSPTGSARTSPRPNAAASPSTSPPPPATSGCSGTPPGAARAGRCRWRGRARRSPRGELPGPCCVRQLSVK